MTEQSDLIANANNFLEIAKRHGFDQEEVMESDENGIESVEDVGAVLKRLLKLQGDIHNLKLLKQQKEVAQRFGGLTSPESLERLMNDMELLAEHLEYIIQHSDRLQNKLANPIVTNSIPCPSSSQVKES